MWRNRAFSKMQITMFWEIIKLAETHFFTKPANDFVLPQVPSFNINVQSVTFNKIQTEAARHNGQTYKQTKKQKSKQTKTIAKNFLLKQTSR